MTEKITDSDLLRIAAKHTRSASDPTRYVTDTVAAMKEVIALIAPSAPGDAQREAVMDAIAGALGDAYDCMRVWAAWGVGTMSQDDFRLVADDASRLGELADAAIAAMTPAPAAGDALAALRELVECDSLKKRIASMQVCVLETEDDVQELDAMMSDLARRQPAAWDAALAAQVPQQGEA